MKNKRKIYWICQFVGWSLFYGQNMVHNLAMNPPNTHWVIVATHVSAMLFSVLLSHIMKGFIVRNAVLEKPLFRRSLILLFYSIIFGFLFKASEIIYELYLITDPGKAESLSQLLNRNFKSQVFEVHYRILSFIEWNICYQLVYYIYKIRDDEIVKLKFEKQIIEFEAQALRSQMNPHFIFNCLNSIKYTIQQHKIEESINYLTVFSKLIRTLLNNSDKKEISLYDEIETCKLYLQLEAVRLGEKFSYSFQIDETIDVKSIQIPALIMQPFIENAIWHGIIPKNQNGSIKVSVLEKSGCIEVCIDDNGVGIDESRKNKSGFDNVHKSKGVNISEARIKLDKFIKQRDIKFTISEKKDEKGLPSGTIVTLTFNKDS